MKPKSCMEYLTETLFTSLEFPGALRAFYDISLHSMPTPSENAKTRKQTPLFNKWD